MNQLTSAYMPRPTLSLPERIHLNSALNKTLQLQKVAVKEEKVEEQVKKAKVTSVKKKAEDLPEIADYERPELEKYEKMDFTPSTREKPEKDKVCIILTIINFFYMINKCF